MLYVDCSQQYIITLGIQSSVRRGDSGLIGSRKIRVVVDFLEPFPMMRGINSGRECSFGLQRWSASLLNRYCVRTSCCPQLGPFGPDLAE